MKRKVGIRPSKFSSAIGFIMGIAFCFFGIYLMFQSFNFFLIIWTLMALLITIYYGINLFSSKGLSLYNMTIEEDKDQTDKQ